MHSLDSRVGEWATASLEDRKGLFVGLLPVPPLMPASDRIPGFGSTVLHNWRSIGWTPNYEATTHYLTAQLETAAKPWSQDRPALKNLNHEKSIYTYLKGSGLKL